jgi:alkanesulfonate monooxygenase SsuD/methylene tetrahydromethanopterin reductase-like flavin-dependent oxidoreductase (luciferase family)
MTSPVVVAANDREGKAMLERMPPERRAHVNVGPPDQAAEGLRPYLDAGFTGFTFNNTTYSTPEQIGAIGELLRLIA